LTALEALVADRIGLDIGSLGAFAFPQAVAQRMQARGVTTRVAYAGLLSDDPAEWAALTAGLVVPETWFFRGGRALFDHLANELSERVRTRVATLPVRILSIPCSTGRGAVFTGNRAPRPASACQRFSHPRGRSRPDPPRPGNGGTVLRLLVPRTRTGPQAALVSRGRCRTCGSCPPRSASPFNSAVPTSAARTLWTRNHPTI